MSELDQLTYIDLCKIGQAARAAAEKEAEAFKRGGIMAVQDSWDASVGLAAVEAIKAALGYVEKIMKDAIPDPLIDALFIGDTPEWRAAMLLAETGEMPDGWTWNDGSTGVRGALMPIAAVKT